MGRIGPAAAKAVPALIGAVRDPDLKVRTHAVAALGQIGPNANLAVAVLTEALRSEEGAVRSGAVTSLSKIVSEPKQVVVMLIFVLKDEDWVVRKSACQALGKVGNEAKDAVVPLMDLLNNDRDRRSASKALRRIDAVDEAALPVLIDGLTSTNDSVRYFACHFLGKIGPPAETALPMIEGLVADDKKQRVREAAKRP